MHLIAGRVNQGLWAVCSESNCRWAFQNDLAIQKNYPVWWVAVQALMAFGLFLGLMSLLVATLALCCECKGCNSSHAVAGILMIGFIIMGIAVVLFGVKAHLDRGTEMELERRSSSRFSWSFYLGISASALSLFTSLIYACDGRNRH
ncbi:hypothetical protein SNE40_021479 [Patella caerulea]